MCRLAVDANEVAACGCSGRCGVADNVLSQFSSTEKMMRGWAGRADLGIAKHSRAMEVWFLGMIVTIVTMLLSHKIIGVI